MTHTQKFGTKDLFVELHIVGNEYSCSLQVRD